MEYEFKIKINVASDEPFGFKDEKEVKKFIHDELENFACVNSVYVMNNTNSYEKLMNSVDSPTAAEMRSINDYVF